MAKIVADEAIKSKSTFIVKNTRMLEQPQFFDDRPYLINAQIIFNDALFEKGWRLAQSSRKSSYVFIVDETGSVIHSSTFKQLAGNPYADTLFCR